MPHTFKSKMVAATLAFGMAVPLTLGGSLISATAAEAGFLGSIKGAAKAVHSTVKRGAVAAAHQVAKLPPLTNFPPVKGVINGYRAVRSTF